jgi:hypothetical protein
MHALASARSAWDADGTLRDAEMTGNYSQASFVSVIWTFCPDNTSSTSYVLALTNLKLSICFLGLGIIISFSVGQHQYVFGGQKVREKYKMF